MKKILIIEDNSYIAELMAEILKGLGEVVVCTKAPEMPLEEEVVALIADADVILLDYDLGMDYNGCDLYPHCKKKKVVSISTSYTFGKVSFEGKKHLSEPHIAQVLKETVAKAIGK